MMCGFFLKVEISKEKTQIYGIMVYISRWSQLIFFYFHLHLGKMNPF